MAVLVTRPHPDNEASADALRRMGLDVLLAPMLRFEPIEFTATDDVTTNGVIVTSANALRSVADRPGSASLHDLPVFAVGGRTAEAARDAGFRHVVDADGDAAALRERIVKTVKRKKGAPPPTLLYFAGADLSRDLAGELDELGFNVVTRICYRMVPVNHMPPDICRAFAEHRIDAILHYSKRTARVFVEAARADGVEISALALLQCCISESVGAVLRDEGASQVSIATTPNEDALFDALTRALSRVSR